MTTSTLDYSNILSVSLSHSRFSLGNRQVDANTNSYCSSLTLLSWSSMGGLKGLRAILSVCCRSAGMARWGSSFLSQKPGEPGSLSAVCPLSGISKRISILPGVSEFVPFPCLSFGVSLQTHLLLPHSLFGPECWGAPTDGWRLIVFPNQVSSVLSR